MRTTHTTAPRAAAAESGGKARICSSLRRLLRPAVKNNGSSMIEVLIAVVVIGIVIVPVFEGFLNGRMMVARRGEERMALRLIERKVEQLLAAGYGSAGDDSDVTSVDVGSGSHPSDPTVVLNTRGNSDMSDDVLGALTWSVQEVDWSSPGDDVEVKVIDVQLAWPLGAVRDSVSVTFMLGR